MTKPSKVLVVRKGDGTIHKVPMANKAGLMAISNRQPADKRWSFEEMSETEAEKLPFIDPEHLTGAEAVEKNKELEGTVSEQEARIKELEETLANQGKAATNASNAEARIKELEKSLTDQRAVAKDSSKAEQRIKELEALLEKQNTPPTPSAKEIIEKIEAAKTVEAVNELSANDARKTVIDAAAKQILELTGGGK